MRHEGLCLTMRVTVRDREAGLRERLSERLNRAAHLRCKEHNKSVEAVMIDGRENGWFDTTWITCCEDLERQAHAIVKQRC